MSGPEPVTVLPRYIQERQHDPAQQFAQPKQSWSEFFSENCLIFFIAFLIVIIIILVGYFVFRAPAKVVDPPLGGGTPKTATTSSKTPDATTETTKPPETTATATPEPTATPQKSAPTKQQLKEKLALAKSRAPTNPVQPVVARTDEEILQLMEDEPGEELEQPPAEEPQASCTFITTKGSRCKNAPKSNGKCGLHADK